STTRAGRSPAPLLWLAPCRHPIAEIRQMSRWTRPFESPDGSVGPGNVRPSCSPSPNVRGAHGDVAQRRRVTPTISVYLPSCPRSSTSSLFQTEVHSCRYPYGGLSR